MSVIEIKHLVRDFGNHKGVFDVSLEVEKGEIYGFLGPNGAGKSTTIRHLMGFLRCEQGSCTINGLDCFDDAARIHETLGYLAGEIVFMEDMKANAYLKYILNLKGIKDESRLNQLKEYFEFDGNRNIRSMSKGMKQKLGIICAFMGDPEVLILDEATSGLDPLMQERFLNLLLEEKAKGKTILMSSHILEEVEKVCDKTAIIKDGKIIDLIQLKDLETMHRKYVKVKGIDHLPELAGITHVKQHGEWLSFFYEGAFPTLMKYLQTLPIDDMEIRSPNLEEVFLRYYEEDTSC